jgi:AraC-like DNA-binding protein
MITSTNIIRAKSGNIGKHSHESEQEFHFFVSGRGTFMNAQHPLRIESGSLVYSNEKEVHAFSNEGFRIPVVFYYLRFQIPDQQRSLIPTLRTKLQETPKITNHHLCHQFFESIRENHHSHNPLLKESASHQFLSFICQLAGGAFHEHTSSRSRETETAIKMMKKALYQKLTLKELLTGSQITPSHFIRKFEKDVGLSPIRYFLKLKMETACELLRETSTPIHTIASELSFCDEFHFSRSFKRIIGVSPKEFRQKNQFDADV